MMLRFVPALGILVATSNVLSTSVTLAMDLVKDGQPAATIVVAEPANGARRGGVSGDRRAAEVLAEWIGKMSDAELPIAARAPERGPVVFVGAAAVEAGLKLDGIQSPTHEGVRIVCDGRRLLIAGQNETSTLKAVCRLLEELGCRYLIDHPLGEVFPRTPTVSIGKLDVAEQPGFQMRSIWGSEWSGNSLWKVWNGAGGTAFGTGHAWGSYVSKELFAEHPEYFQLRDGKRNPSDWYCTSNPGLRKIFADGVIAKLERNDGNPSISPPDGRGYCQCEACQKQDDPNSLEPSTGTICVSNRYCDFFKEVARQVGRQHPDAVLSFYCYADYTQAPTSGIQLPPNLCAWVAPIRYCRFHRIGHPDCPSRCQLEELLDGWAAAADKMGYRTYNYNLAECCVPVSKISVWKHDLPYLKEKGCIGVNLETLTNWQIYGPHIYLSIRLAYDPSADADAILDDYFDKLYGPAAAPMKQYWLGIDAAFDRLKCHSGSFYAVHLVYTDAFLSECRKQLDEAASAVKGNKTYAARVEMTRHGLRNAEEYCVIRDAMHRGDFQTAKQVYDRLLSRSEAQQQTKLGNHYTVGYLKRFLGKQVEAGAAATAAPRRVLAVLPDQWRLAYDEADEGAAQGYAGTDLEDANWLSVATFSEPLDAQGIEDRQTIQWYRCKFKLPKQEAKLQLALFLTEIDGDATVYVNGREVGQSERKRTPFEVDVTSAAVEGENTVAIRVDHTNITDLFLGGILRPILLVAGAPAAKP